MVKISDGGDGFQGRTPKPTKAQIEARSERQKALDEKQSRKDDTRRKILIGAVVLEHCNDEMLAFIIDIIKSHKSPHNAIFFDGWSRSPKKSNKTLLWALFSILKHIPCQFLFPQEQ